MRFAGSGEGYPPELLRSPRWYALRTRARAEKRVDGLLREVGLEAYPALVTVKRQWSDRVQPVGLPLFPGYVFARFALEDIGVALARPGVVHVIRQRGVPAPLRDEEMEAVRQLAEGVTATGELPSDEDFLAVGDPVVVAEGPFQGMEGVLVEARGRTRFVVRIPAIRQARGVELPKDLLRRRKAA